MKRSEYLLRNSLRQITTKLTRTATKVGAQSEPEAPTPFSKHHNRCKMGGVMRCMHRSHLWRTWSWKCLHIRKSSDTTCHSSLRRCNPHQDRDRQLLVLHYHIRRCNHTRGWEEKCKPQEVPQPAVGTGKPAGKARG